MVPLHLPGNVMEEIEKKGIFQITGKSSLKISKLLVNGFMETFLCAFLLI